MSIERMTDLVRLQAVACQQVGSVLYEGICEAIAVDLEAGGPTRDVFLAHEDLPARAVPALRLLGAVHRIVLEGRAPELAASYPSAGGTFDPGSDPEAALAAERFLAVVADHRDEVVTRMHDGVQTNEPARTVALLGGFHEVGRATRLPLRVLELGPSAGLNLRWDRFHYRLGPDLEWGDPSSPLQFDGGFEGAPPELWPDLEVVERRGGDRNPLDPTEEDTRLRLLSFVWPDQDLRFARLRAAFDVAATLPVTIDQADGVTWVREQLATPVPGVATVLFHSAVIMYFSNEDRAALTEAIEAAGGRATADAPLAWMGMELGGEMNQITLRMWPHAPEPVVVADCSYHGPPVHWHGSPR